MIENRVPNAPHPPGIHMPLHTPVSTAAAIEFIDEDLSKEIEPLIAMDLSEVKDSMYIADLRPDILRQAWDDLCKAFMHTFANDLGQHPTLELAAQSLLADGNIGRYVNKEIDVYGRREAGKREPITLLAAFNEYFGACKSVKDKKKRVDGLGSALNLQPIELKCPKGTKHRLQELQLKLLASDLLITGTYFATRDRFAIEHGIDHVHDKHFLGTRVTGSSHEGSVERNQRMMAEVTKDLEREISALLRVGVPGVITSLDKLFSRPSFPTIKELGEVHDRFLIAWTTMFSAGVGPTELMQNETYFKWNQNKDVLQSIDWRKMLADIADKMLPLLTGVPLVEILAKNEWARHLLNDDAFMFKLATSSADTVDALIKAFPRDWLALRDPNIGTSCLYRLTANHQAVHLLENGTIDVSRLFDDTYDNGRYAFQAAVRAVDRQSIASVYFHCLQHEDSEVLLRKMNDTLVTWQSVNSHFIRKPGTNTAADWIKQMHPVFADDAFFQYCQALGDPVKVRVLLKLAATTQTFHFELTNKDFGKLSVAQLEAIAAELPVTEANPRYQGRVVRFMNDHVKEIMDKPDESALPHTSPPPPVFTPAKIHATAHVVGNNTNAGQWVGDNFASWKELEPEVMLAVGEILSSAPAGQITGEEFLRKHGDRFFQLDTQQQIETARAYAGHAAYLHKHAKTWFALDHAQMNWTRRALETGLLGKLRRPMIFATPKPMLDPQAAWFKLSAAKMAGMAEGYARTGGNLVLEKFPLLAKLDDRQIFHTAAMLKNPESRAWLNGHFSEWRKLDANAMKQKLATFSGG
jgi:hypothetical protein